MRLSTTRHGGIRGRKSLRQGCLGTRIGRRTQFPRGSPGFRRRTCIQDQHIRQSPDRPVRFGVDFVRVSDLGFLLSRGPGARGSAPGAGAGPWDKSPPDPPPRPPRRPPPDSRLTESFGPQSSQLEHGLRRPDRARPPPGGEGEGGGGRGAVGEGRIAPPPAPPNPPGADPGRSGPPGPSGAVRPRARNRRRVVRRRSSGRRGTRRRPRAPRGPASALEARAFGG